MTRRYGPFAGAATGLGLTGVAGFLAATTGLALTGVAGFILAGCADNKVAGATSETTNGDVQAVLTTTTGAPAARVTVRVVDEAGWMEKLVDGKSPVLDSAVTDDQGRFQVKVPVARRCNLQVESGGEGLIVRGINALADTGQGVPVSRWKLAPLSTLAGKVGADTGLVEALGLAGTLYSAAVTGDGLYRFEGIAADTHQAVARVYHSEAARPAMARAVAVAPGLAVIAPDMQVGVHRILIDDFERGFGATALGRLLGGGAWFLNADTLSGGTSTRETSLVTGAEADAGTSLHARYLLGTRLENPFATVAFHLGPKAGPYDLGGLKAISFRARGSGDVIVRFTSRSVQAIAADSAHFHYSVALPAAWTRIVIPVDSLRVFANAPDELKTWPWSRAAKDVTTIDFKASRPSSLPGDTVLLWLDEVQLEGVPLERFVP